MNGYCLLMSLNFRERMYSSFHGVPNKRKCMRELGLLVLLSSSVKVRPDRFEGVHTGKNTSQTNFTKRFTSFKLQEKKVQYGINKNKSIVTIFSCGLVLASDS